MTRVVLGSASAGRLRVLQQAGIDPLVVVSDVDEEAIIDAMDPDTPPEAVVAKLANAKAVDVAAKLSADVTADCVVLGCDTMLYLDGQLRGKPGTADAALHQWRAMAGSTGHLLTGHALLRISSGVITHTGSETGSTTMHFAKPTVDELAAYVVSGEPVHVAGAFTLDGLGGWFIDRISGDPSNVIGISLPLVRSMLAAAELSVADLWP
ncbi:septum formation inhibitor Maf [Mycolicibacterium duvalii]|uniref:Nucleoside triphosphate pyrophosphatase n=1 Tax=Mycolicibacterium duvalii TaxID=39688 RepID=A0A7I7K3H6_9MYCO|nr:nucleoside triphosphate pyrophosphatase [Mycolicibacterium duvalii]MCV7370607.1 septum formation inhibitor Maf [Mycolicibacterium duvalii]PEG39894.1 septum formation inhibitor Maf [Mycolicibacterium duvalii]BBX18011.1 Maf-like protein [Mycolicibacterium duvalii]